MDLSGAAHCMPKRKSGALHLRKDAPTTSVTYECTSFAYSETNCEDMGAIIKVGRARWLSG